MRGITFGIDFDGTCVTHDYPRVGKDIGASEVLLRLVAHGHSLVLNTMRSGKELEDAVEWFRNNNIDLYGINENPAQKKWTSSPKVYAEIYIDDAALGCPTAFSTKLSDRRYVDWQVVEDMLENMKVFDYTFHSEKSLTSEA